MDSFFALPVVVVGSDDSAVVVGFAHLLDFADSCFADFDYLACYFFVWNLAVY